jgi:hypothetical protein
VLVDREIDDRSLRDHVRIVGSIGRIVGGGDVMTASSPIPLRRPASRRSWIGVRLRATFPSMKKKTTSTTTKSESPAKLIDARIKELGDWRGKMLAHVRALIRQADPDVVETWKWRGVPVWEDHGIICTGETYKAVVKLTFAKGAALDDPSKLFNSSLDGNVRRAIDLHEDDKLNEAAFKKLIRAAAALNKSKGSK